MVVKTWKGWYIQQYRDGDKRPCYVASIYRGKVEWTTDYTHARYYKSEHIARKHDKKIAEGAKAEAKEALIEEIERYFSEEDAFYIILELSLGGSVDGAIQNVLGGKYDEEF